MMNTMTTWSRRKNGENRKRAVKPFCKCFEDETKSAANKSPFGGCICGEQDNVNEWRWEPPTNTESSIVVMTFDGKQVTFHPFYSSGTAVVRGNTPFLHGYQYYWEVKMLSEPYGTDVMVGLGTKKVDTDTSRYRFTSLLGQDSESYGLSYTGSVRHNDFVSRDGAGFCKGSIIGVKVDLWHGTLEFFLNRQSRGISFYNLRRHPSQSLFPMLSSTAAQSSFRLIYSSSWQASLLVDAAKILGASYPGDLPVPPGLKNKMKNHFWLTLPNGTYVLDEDQNGEAEMENDLIRHEGFPFTYREYYTDNISRDHRISLIYDDIDMDPNQAA